MIIRECPYVMVTKKVLEDKELSWEAKGFYSFLSCYDSEVEITMTSKMETLSQELISKGYMQIHDDKFTLII